MYTNLIIILVVLVLVALLYHLSSPGQRGVDNLDYGMKEEKEGQPETPHGAIQEVERSRSDNAVFNYALADVLDLQHTLSLLTPDELKLVGSIRTNKECYSIVLEIIRKLAKDKDKSDANIALNYLRLFMFASHYLLATLICSKEVFGNTAVLSKLSKTYLVFSSKLRQPIEDRFFEDISQIGTSFAVDKGELADITPEVMALAVASMSEAGWCYIPGGEKHVFVWKDTIMESSKKNLVKK